MERCCHFNDFSEEVFFNCFQNLEGVREAAALAPVSKVWAELLGPGNAAMWKTFGAQEYGNSNLQAPPAPKDKTTTSIDFTGVDRYASLARAANLKKALWGRVPTSGFGSREGTPWIFIGRTGEELFAFGGYGPRGPANDLMVASLSALKEVLTVSSAGVHVSSAASSSRAPPQAEQQAEPTGQPAEPPLGDKLEAQCASSCTPEAPQPQSDSAEATAPRLDFKPVAPRGIAPLHSYGATVTPLVDDELPNCEWFDVDALRQCVRETSMLEMLPKADAVARTTIFLVTGGYRSGGYRNESPDWTIGVVCSGSSTADPSGGTDDQAPSGPFSPPSRTATTGNGGAPLELPGQVLWLKPGPVTSNLMEDGPPNRPTPRSNATAVFVPSRFADTSSYPNGYVLLFGGNINGTASDTVDVLDLKTFVWTPLGSLPNAPRPRNSHSAILMPDAEEPSSKAKILIFGGGTGQDVPRAGEDLEDFFTFDPRAMAWLGPAVVPTRAQEQHESAEPAQGSRPLVPGRAHVAVKVGRSVLFFGGGRSPTNQLSAVLCQQLSERRAKRLSATTTENEDESAESDAWGKMLRSLRWKPVPPCGDDAPAPRSFHAAVSLAPAGVPVLLCYGGWHPRRGNFGDIWAAKLDPWAGDEHSCAVGQRAVDADERFSQTLSVTSGGAMEEEADDDDDDEDFGGGGGPLVNVGGRIIPLQIFSQLLRAQFGEQEGARRLQEMMNQGRGGDEEEEDSDDAEDENAEEEDGFDE